MLNDPMEFMKQELRRQDTEEASRIDTIGGRPVDHRIGISDQYLKLDSIERNVASSNLSEGKLVFDIYAGGTTGNSPGMIGVKDDLNDVVEIELMPFVLPILADFIYVSNATGSISTLPTLTDNPGTGSGTRTQLITDRIILELSEASLQSFSGSNNKRYSFECYTTTINGITTVIPINRTFVFTDPIIRFDTLTVSLRTQYAPIQFSNDIIKNTVLTSNITANKLDIQTTEDNGLSVGDRIYIRNLRYPTTLDHRISRYLNRVEGLYVGTGTTASNIVLNPTVDIASLISSDLTNTASSTQNQTVIVNTLLAPIGKLLVSAGDLGSIVSGTSFTFNSKLINTINQHILLKDQTDATQNGIYHVSKLVDIRTSDIILTHGVNITGAFDLIIPSRRVEIPMRFRKLMRRVTNMMSF
jgi:hypothetical protein